MTGAGRSKRGSARTRSGLTDRPSFYLVPSSVAMSVDDVNFLGEAIKKANSVEAGKVVPA